MKSLHRLLGVVWIGPSGLSSSYFLQSFGLWLPLNIRPVLGDSVRVSRVD